jgi:hypothetical protein
MGLRDVTALALVGWYLLSPPPKRSGPFETDALRAKDGSVITLHLYTYYFSAPLSEWNHSSEQYETKADCEAVRDRFRRSVNEKRWIGSSRVLEKLATAAKCVPTGDGPSTRN